MQLSIKNFGTIKDANIIVDGITVITGNNNTGKSTIGKVFYTFFNSFYEIEEKIDLAIENKRRNLYEDVIYKQVIENNMDKLDRSRVAIRRRVEYIVDEVLEKNEKDSNIVYEILKENLADRYHIEKDVITKIINEFKAKEKELNEIESIEIEKEILTRYFKKIFYGQINSLIDVDSEAEISVQIKKKEFKLIFKNDSCIDIVGNPNIVHEAFYIDDPFIVDEMGDYYFGYRRYRKRLSFPSIREHLISKLSESVETMDNIVDVVISKEKLQQVDKILDETIGGKIVLERDGDLGLQGKQYSRPLKLSNLSTGLKAFIVIKRLLEVGQLRDKDVLIFDEPEIHLHPEWQMVYAELIALLQEKFDMTIIVTTHSVEFLEAIEYYSKKYKIENKCNYYMSVEKDGGYQFQPANNDLAMIYKKMIKPGLELDKLKYQLEDE